MTAARSQVALIAAHLKKGARLTSLDALRLFGCNRLAARINDLRRAGMNIVTRMIAVIGSNGVAWVAEYSLAREVA